MTLAIYTARVSYKGPDRLDVTRKGRDPLGIVFAPSWEILLPVLKIREAARAQGLPERSELEEQAWENYQPLYLAEMAASEKRWPRAWAALLRRQEVTLLCFCRDRDRCHRLLLAQLLVERGAEYAGERAAAKPAQLEFGGRGG